MWQSTTMALKGKNKNVLIKEINAGLVEPEWVRQHQGRHQEIPSGTPEFPSGLAGVLDWFVHVPDNTLLNRESHGNMKGGQMGKTQQDTAELVKQTPLEGFGQKIGEHMFVLTISKSDVVRVETVSDKEIPNINMS